jgi:D-3-phosphoglycerate dehydrogenase / 2-oxoglutarate reductase
MNRPIVLLTDRAWPDAQIESTILAEAGYELVEAQDGREETLVALARNCSGILTNWARVTPAIIDAAGGLKAIGRTGIGLDNIAIPAATARGIPVTNVPDYCVEEVADHALALLLSLWRKTAFFNERAKRGEYVLSAGPKMHRLRGRRLGLVGLGRTGQAVASRAMAFGLEVVAWTPSGQNRGLPVTMLPLSELLATSEAVSLHLPLVAETRHLLNAQSLAGCRSGITVINTSRGGLIDRTALWAGIQSGQIAAAGLDVFEEEPPNLAEPLYRDERVLVTPHAAFVSEESLDELRRRAARQMVVALGGERPENVVNPEVYLTQRVTVR